MADARSCAAIACVGLFVASSSACEFVVEDDHMSGSADDDQDDDDDDDADPRIESIAPRGGPFGAEVVVRGEWLTGNTAADSLASPRLLFGPQEEEVTAQVIEWTDSTIRLRWPYAAEGPLTVVTNVGRDSVDGFVPTWRVSEPREGPGAERIASAILSDGSVAMIDQVDDTTASLVWFREDGIQIRDLGGPVSHAVIVEDRGRPAGWVLRPLYDDRELVELRWDGDRLDVRYTDVLTSWDVAILAGAIEGTGMFAWIHSQNDDSFVRVGAHADGWSIDRGPIPAPTSGRSSSSAIVRADGTFVLAWADDRCDPLDCWSEDGYFAELAPDADAFGPVEHVLDGLIERTRMHEADDGRLFYSGCYAKVEDAWNVAAGCVVRIRDADGAWTDPSLPSDAAPTKWHTFVPGRGGALAVAYCTLDDELRVTADAEYDAGSVVRSPCVPLEGGLLGDLWIGEDGAPSLLTSVGIERHVATPRDP